MSKKQFLYSGGFISIILLLSYIAGRFLFPQLITDDVGDYFLWISSLCFICLIFIYLSGYKIVKRLLKLSPVFNIICGISIAGLLVFGVWGMYTKQGHKHFDEMDAIFPFSALVIGFIVVAVILFLNVFQFSKNKNNLAYLNQIEVKSKAAITEGLLTLVFQKQIKLRTNAKILTQRLDN
jgi:hypothetical protein